jgi:hypothetical protein
MRELYLPSIIAFVVVALGFLVVSVALSLHRNLIRSLERRIVALEEES